MHTEYGQLSGCEGLKDPITESCHASHPAYALFPFFFFLKKIQSMECLKRKKAVLCFSVLALSTVEKQKTYLGFRVTIKVNERVLHVLAIQ